MGRALALARRARPGTMLWVGAAALVGALLFTAAASMLAAVLVRNGRAADLRARTENISLFGRAELVAQGVAESVGATLLPTLQWDADAESPWSPWLNIDDGPCDLVSSAYCWQAKLGPVAERTARAGIVHRERPLYLRVISECRFDPAAAPPQAPPVNVPAVELAALCESVETSQDVYRERSWLQYGLHVGSQDLSPRQIKTLGSSITSPTGPLDASIDFATGNIPFHTNEEQIVLCTHGVTEGVIDGVKVGWPSFGTNIEVSNNSSALPDGTVAPVEDAFKSAGGACDPPIPFPVCPPDPPGEPCATGHAPAGTTVLSGTQLLVVQQNVEQDTVAETRCDQASVSPPAWMAPAAVAAEEASTVFPHGGVIDLATAADQDIYFSSGDISVIGRQPAGSRVSVVAGGSLRLADAVLGPPGSGLLSLVAGCDIIIPDPTAGDPTIGLSSSDAVSLTRVALLAPHGALFAEAFSRPPVAAGVFPAVTINGAVATRYMGLVGAHDRTGQIGGYQMSLRYPTDFRDEVPPWWPDPLGGAWQRVG